MNYIHCTRACTCIYNFVYVRTLAIIPLLSVYTSWTGSWCMLLAFPSHPTRSTKATTPTLTSPYLPRAPTSTDFIPTLKLGFSPPPQRACSAPCWRCSRETPLPQGQAELVERRRFVKSRIQGMWNQTFGEREREGGREGEGEGERESNITSICVCCSVHCR